MGKPPLEVNLFKISIATSVITHKSEYLKTISDTIEKEKKFKNN